MTAAPVRPRRFFTLARLLLGLASALAGAAGWLWWSGGRLPSLDAGRLAAARQTWRAAAVTRYRFVLETSASQLAPSRLAVRVEDGRVEAGGANPASYTVEGLFDLLDRELEMAADPQRWLGAPAGYRAWLYARFDPATGVPVAFRRVVGGTDRWAQWRVVDFEARR